MILFANLANELYAVLFVAAVLGVCILFCWVMLRPSLHPKQKGLATERYRWLRLCLMALVLGPLMSCSIEIFVLILVEASFRDFVYFVPIMAIVGTVAGCLGCVPIALGCLLSRGKTGVKGKGNLSRFEFLE